MICVLRLGHRIERDKRLSTHCGLAARALGAEKMLYSGQKDSGLEESINSATKQWGGSFSVEYTESPNKTIKKWKGKVAHLTIYGLPLQDKIKEIRKEKVLLLVVGGEKVPPEFYQEADWNLSVTGQPHSEVAALAIFLHEYFQGKELGKRFKNSRRVVIPQEKGKKVLEKA
jgi:tRNA (cytidine56-2'-O)-methyltransferase